MRNILRYMFLVPFSVGAVLIFISMIVMYGLDEAIAKNDKIKVVFE